MKEGKFDRKVGKFVLKSVNVYFEDLTKGLLI